MTKKKADYESWKVGDKVTSIFRPKQSRIVRTILMIERNSNYNGGFCVSTDGGEPCPHCGNQGVPIHRVSASWFEPYTEGQ